MITFDVNNGGKLALEQSKHDGVVTVKGCGDDFAISPGDMVMLINYYRYVKDNDIQCDFINYDGKNKR